MVFLALLVLLVFGQSVFFDFIRFDEEQYVTLNPHVLSGLSWRNIGWAFTTFDAGFWHPLTWISLMADAHIYGLFAGGYHGTNLLLHLLSTLLLFLVLRRMTGVAWQSVLVAALFAVHPLHVEPVAWIASRKDVLSTFFWILTMAAYVRYTEHRIWQRYVTVLICFAMGLMAKPMVVTLPIILLLCDYWPLGRLGLLGTVTPETGERCTPSLLIWEKMPMLVMAFLAGCLTIATVEGAGAMPTLGEMPLSLRLGNAVWAYVFYLWKTVWPFHLAVFYPHPGVLPLWKTVGSFFFLLLITGGVLYWGRIRPHLAIGWLWYVVTLLPVSGLLQVGSHAMADRYTYIPLIGLFIGATWEAGTWFPLQRYGRAARMALGISVVLFWAFISWMQVRHWQNSLTLFSHALCATNGNYLSYNNIGVELLTRGDVAGAEENYRKALAIKPNYATTLHNLGNIRLGQGRFDDAILLYRHALKSNPGYTAVYRNLGDAYLRRGFTSRPLHNIGLL